MSLNIFHSFKQQHPEEHGRYENEKKMKRGQPKNVQTLSETVLSQKTLDIAVTKLIVKKILPVSIADDEHFREYSWGKFV